MTCDKLYWINKRWTIEEDEGELEFLQDLFGKEIELHCMEEPVTQFRTETISQASNINTFFFTELVTEKENIGPRGVPRGRIRLSQLTPSRFYKPEKCYWENEKQVTVDIATLSIIVKHNHNTDTKKLNIDVQKDVLIGNDSLYHTVSAQKSHINGDGVYLCLQTVSDMYYVNLQKSIKTSLKSLNLSVPSESQAIMKQYLIKRTYTPHDEDNKCHLLIELESGEQKAYVKAFSKDK